MSIKIQRRDFLLGFGFLGLMQTNQLKAMVSGSVPNNIPDLSLPLNNVLSLLGCEHPWAMSIKHHGIITALCMLKRTRISPYQ